MYFLSTENIDTLASFSASNFEPLFEVSNIQDPRGTSTWRSTSTTPFLVGKFNAAKLIDAWGSWYVNAGIGDKTQLRLADTEAELTSSPLIDTGLINILPGTGDLSSFGYIHQRSTITPTTALWFRIDYSMTTVSFAQVGALFVGERFSPADSQENKWNPILVNRLAYQSNMAGGGISRGGFSDKRGVRFSFAAMTISEFWGKFSRLTRERGHIKPVGVVLDETENTYPMDHMYYGYLESEKYPREAGRFMFDVTIIEP